MVSVIDILYLKQKRLQMGIIIFSAVNSTVYSFVHLFITFIYSLIHFKYTVISFHRYKQLFVVLSKLHQSLLSTLGPVKGILIIARFGRRNKKTHLHLVLL